MLLVVLAVCALAVPLAAHASDATLKTTLGTWSRRIAADAHSLQLSAQHRHPRRLASTARRFRADALHARRVLAATRPSTVKGARARKLALAAFAEYAIVGRDWALAGQARLRKHRPAAIRYAQLAKTHARRGGQQLTAAGKLLA